LRLAGDGVWKIPSIFYFTHLKRAKHARKIRKVVLKTSLKTRETTTESTTRAFSAFLENSLRIISGA
jgi:hypothetical protein